MASRLPRSGWGVARTTVALAAIACLFPLAACNSVKPKPVAQAKAHINNETKFSVKEYGVAASPRVTEAKRVKKGGGRDMVGKPYKIKGKWYKPKEDPNYQVTGLASWYGPNFHGRLTANGEIYDQYALSAAHPTMPLPSYARVTNIENGSSVMVRVNDRGPYAHGRVLDLSSKAADLLDFKRKGVAKVKVEYVGRARMDGHDDKFLLASYRAPGGQLWSPGATQAGTMIALNSDQRQEPAVLAAQAVVSNTGAGVPGSGSTGETDDSAETVMLASLANGAAQSFVPQRRPTDYGGVPLDIADGAPMQVALLAPLSYAAEAESDMAPFDALLGRPVIVSLGLFASEGGAEFVAAQNSDLAELKIRHVRDANGEGWEVAAFVAAEAAIAVLNDARSRGFEARALAYSDSVR